MGGTVTLSFGHIQISECSEILASPKLGVVPGRRNVVAVTRATKSEVAQEVWQALLGYFVTQRSHQLHAAQELGLTPGHVKTLFELDADQPVSMGELAS